jgi:RimJ/RimL family protein N-acetyltransferase
MTYKVLQQNTVQQDVFSLVPIRMEDRMAILKWRNEQLYHLRQQKPLKAEDQEYYFNHVVAQLFDQAQPNQILFSFLENGVCIGYGGLVHINWTDQNAEISFIMDTALEVDRFHEIWSAFLALLEIVAFSDLKFHKIYTYAFDLRPHLYQVLEANNFIEEARLKEHCFFDNQFKDVVFHAKINSGIILKVATEEHLDITFEWASDTSIRRYSVNKETIQYVNHRAWFINEIKTADCLYLIAEINHQPIGSVRFDINEKQEAIISYLLDAKFQGKGFGRHLLFEGEKMLLKNRKVVKISGLVFKENIASIKAFSYLRYDKIDLDDSSVIFEKMIKAAI